MTTNCKTLQIILESSLTAGLFLEEQVDKIAQRRETKEKPTGFVKVFVVREGLLDQTTLYILRQDILCAITHVSIAKLKNIDGKVLAYFVNQPSVDRTVSLNNQKAMMLCQLVSKTK